MTYIPKTYPQTLERNPADFTGPKPSIFARALSALALPAEYVKALDVARYQMESEVDYAKAYAGGYRLVIIKATQGIDYLDPMYKWHWQHALDAGFYIMLYHFFLDHLDGGQQADWFLQSTYEARTALQGKVAAWNDIERNPVTSAATVSTRRTRAQAWKLAVNGDIQRVGAYSSPALWQELMGNDILSKYGDGCLAHWTSAKSPTIPPGWTEAGTRIWQTGVYPTYPWVEPVPGVLGTVDVDRWFGNEQSLRDYLGYVDAPPAPVDPLEARVKMLEDIAAKHMVDIDGLKQSHNDVVDNLTELNGRIETIGIRLIGLENAYGDFEKRITALEDKPTTPPASGVPFTIISRANLRVQKGEDKAGKPIMVIQEPRVQFDPPAVIRVDPAVVTATGMEKYYRVMGYANPLLYVRAVDGRIE